MIRTFIDMAEAHTALPTSKMIIEIQIIQCISNMLHSLLIGKATETQDMLNPMPTHASFSIWPRSE
jgi:hypothetical protein